MKYWLFVLFLAVIFSCNKTDYIGTFTGTVVGKTLGCSGPGTIDAYDIKMDHFDGMDSETIRLFQAYGDSTFSTVTLPMKYQVPGKRLKFKMRNYRQGDLGMTCDGNVIWRPIIVEHVCEIN